MSKKVVIFLVLFSFAILTIGFLGSAAEEALVVGPGATRNQLPSAKEAGITDFSQAPMSKKSVEEGELPPLEERIPSDPVVVKPVNRVGQYGGTWNRVHGSEGMGQWYQTYAYEPFVRWTRDAKGYIPNLLRSWEWNQDKTEITVHFVKGIKWSDGTPLTAEDFLFWWKDMVLDERVPITLPKGTHTAGDPMKVDKVDDYTLVFKFSASNPIFLQHMNLGPWSSAHWMVPAHYMKQFHPEYNDELKDEETQKLMDHYDNRHQYPGMPTYYAWKTVEYQSGKKAVFERNPYYWKVDTEGNQLPYIDRVVSRRIEDPEMQVLKTVEGKIDAKFRGYDLRDFPFLKSKEDKGNYRVIRWNRAEFAWPWLMVGYNHPDKAIRDLMYKVKFRQALSYAINRQQINNVVFLGLADPRQMALNPKVPVFQTAEGEDLWERWANSYAEFKPEKAKALLDEIGMVDENGDGFRERPDGKKFNLIVDVSSGDTRSIDALQLIKKTWQNVGIKTTINPMAGEAITVKREEGKYMMSAWGSAAAWWPMMDPFIWTPTTNFPQTIAPLCGLYYKTKGEEGMAPREGSVLEKLQEAYREASKTVDREKRKDILMEAFEMHITEGPVTIGTVASSPSTVVVKDNFHNVPTFGLIAHWYIGYPGTANPEQFFIGQE